jgi:hypothetical protein
MTESDRLLQELAALDPAPPADAPRPGSPHGARLLERVLAVDHIPSRGNEPRRRRSRRRFVAPAAAAAAVLATLFGIATFGPERSLSPVAALEEAGENTGAAETHRTEYVREQDDGSLSVIRTEHRGRDERRTYSVIEPDGTERTDAVESDEFRVFIGDRGWTAEDAAGDGVPVRPEERNAPYAESSAAILDAAVSESTVTEVGVDDVRGVEATHYRVRLDAEAVRRLEQLPANQLSGFELEYPAEVRSLDVWIADGYVRRINVKQNFEAPGSTGTTVEFYDFGADITIEPPGS